MSGKIRQPPRKGKRQPTGRIDVAEEHAGERSAAIHGRKANGGARSTAASPRAHRSGSRSRRRAGAARTAEMASSSPKGRLKTGPAAPSPSCARPWPRRLPVKNSTAPRRAPTPPTAPTRRARAKTAAIQTRNSCPPPHPSVRARSQKRSSVPVPNERPLSLRRAASPASESSTVFPPTITRARPPRVAARRYSPVSDAISSAVQRVAPFASWPGFRSKP